MNKIVIFGILLSISLFEASCSSVMNNGNSTAKNGPQKIGKITTSSNCKIISSDEYSETIIAQNGDCSVKTNNSSYKISNGHTLRLGGNSNNIGKDNVIIK